MNRFNFFLTAVLLILIGVGIGLILNSTKNQNSFIHVPTQMAVTEIQRSLNPPAIVEGVPATPFTVSHIAELVIPTVVYIETSVPVNRRGVPNDGNHDFDQDIWDRFLPRGRSNAIGTGVIISPDGFILTNNHVVSGGRDVRVTLNDKREFDAIIIGTDPSTDLAVLKIDERNLNHIVIGNSENVRVGDWVMAVGNPLRLKSTVTTGIVSALSRDVQIINDRMRIESFIQTDAAINRGNSGGPLVNQFGELVGINTAIATESGGYQGYGFAIPVNMAFKIAGDIMEFGEVQRAFLGVQISSVNQERAQRLRLPAIRGVEILDVVQDGAAQRAGLKRNDVVLEVNDVAVNESNELQAQVALFRPGQNVDLKIWRGGTEQTIQVLLTGLENRQLQQWANRIPFEPEIRDEELPENMPESGLYFFEQGFVISEFAQPEEPGKFDLKVLSVLEGSEADSAGLQADDIILSINDVLVTDGQSLKAGFENAPVGFQNTIEVLRGEDLIQIHF